MAAAGDRLRGETLRRLLAEPTREDFRDLPCLQPDSLFTDLQWGSGMRGREPPGLYPQVARKLAYQRRLRLALAVSILCQVQPGAARMARWHEVDHLGKEVWTVPVVNTRPGPKTRRVLATAGNTHVPIPLLAVKAFSEAFELRDGMKLLLGIVRPIRSSLEESHKRLRWPRRPPPPHPGALVFPGRDGRSPLPEHAFRKLLERWGIGATPSDFIG